MKLIRVAVRNFGITPKKKNVSCGGCARWPAINEKSCDQNGRTERNIAMYAGGTQQHEGDVKSVDQCGSFPLL